MESSVSPKLLLLALLLLLLAPVQQLQARELGALYVHAARACLFLPLMPSDN
jgi:hypothetical protein